MVGSQLRRLVVTLATGSVVLAAGVIASPPATARAEGDIVVELGVSKAPGAVLDYSYSVSTDVTATGVEVTVAAVVDFAGSSAPEGTTCELSFLGYTCVIDTLTAGVPVVIHVRGRPLTTTPSALSEVRTENADPSNDRGFLAAFPEDVCDQVGDGGPEPVVGTKGDDILCGSIEDDVLQGLAGDDVILGSLGYDTVSYAGAKPVRVNLSQQRRPGPDATGAGDDYLDDIEFVLGSSRSDVLIGDDGNNVLVGGKGADRIVGSGEDDKLVGGKGRDHLFGGDGSDLCVELVGTKASCER